jgi:hypothetical protein
MIICTLINAHGLKRVAKFKSNVPPTYVMANNKLFRVDPGSWSTPDERLANISPTYNEVWCPNFSDILELPEEPTEQEAA